MNMQLLISLLGLIIFMLSTQVFAAQAGIFTQPLPDIEKFSCKYCPDPEEAKKTVEVDVGINTNKNAKYMEYNGQNGEHVIPNLNATFGSLNEAGRYYDITITDLGLASRELNLHTGIFGNYEANIDYDQITHYQMDDFITPFGGVDTETLSKMPSTHTTDIRQDRHRFNILAKKVINPQWETIVDYKLENKQGLKTIGAAVGSEFYNASSVMLPEPIDQITQLIKLGLAYSDNKFQLEGGYKGSLFNNSVDQLQWENVFEGDPNYGRFALSPDSQHHQLYALGAWRVKPWLKLKGQLSLGQIRQDQKFVGYSTLATNNVLPKSSLGGQVNTSSGNFRANVDFNKKLGADANLYFDRKDNETSQASYNYVTLDTTPGTTRTNIPYGYHKYGADITGNYLLSSDKRASTGYKFLRMSRPYSEVNISRSNEYWVKYKHRLVHELDMSLRYSYEQRTASDYLPFANPEPAQNPLMRKYNLADKDKNLLSVAFDYSGIENVMMNFYVDYSADDYSKTEIGLTEAIELAYGVNIYVMLGDAISFNAYMSQENVQSTQIGSVDGSQLKDNFWTMENEDKFTSLGFNIKWMELRKNLDAGFDFAIARANGLIALKQNNLKDDLPALISDRYTFELYSMYHYDEDLSIKASYLFETYDESDWHVNNATYSSSSSLYNAGTAAYSYNAHFISASIIYRF